MLVLISLGGPSIFSICTSFAFAVGYKAVAKERLSVGPLPVVSFKGPTEIYPAFIGMPFAVCGSRTDVGALLGGFHSRAFSKPNLREAMAVVASNFSSALRLTSFWGGF